jgi:hypothetical protein
VKELAAIINEAEIQGLRFIVIGGLAVIAYGSTRVTYDADLMVPRGDLPLWERLLGSLGYAVEHQQETFAQFQPPMIGMWPVDLMLVNDDTFDKVQKQAVERKVAGRTHKVPSAFHLVALKLHALKYGPPRRRDKDLSDIVELIELQKIDIASKDFLETCEHYGTAELRDEIRIRLER